MELLGGRLPQQVLEYGKGEHLVEGVVFEPDAVSKLLAKGFRQMFGQFCILERFNVEVEGLLAETYSFVVV